MVPFIIGGIALAATGYGVKKYLENDDNRDKVIDKLDDAYNWLDKTEQKGLEFFDNLEKKVDDHFDNERKRNKNDILYVDLSDNDESYILPELKEYVEKFESATRKLYNSSLLDLQTALNEIKGLERDLHLPSLSLRGKKYNFVSINDDIKASFESYTAILLNIKEHIDIELDKLDEILLKSNDYSSYSDEEKLFIQKLVNIQVTVDTATQSKMTLDKEHFTREVKRAFRKLESVLLLQ